MELREDEIAYLGESRCFCGHLYALHNYESGWCLIELDQHHFCSQKERDEHFRMTALEIGSPAVGRKPRCAPCQGLPLIPHVV